MKKIVTLAAFTFTVVSAMAQDDALSKNVRFGLMVSPSINWYKSTEKIIEKNGISPKFGGGLAIEFRLTNVAVIATGLMINTDGGKVSYKNDISYNPSTSYINYFYDVENDEIADYNTGYNAYVTGSTRYSRNLLNERKYMMTYVTIPLALKLRTKEIGALTYYGMFGVNNSIRVAAKATDKVQQPALTSTGWGQELEITKTDIKKDASLFNESLNMGLGVEWNLSGSTSLVIGANYFLGFSNVVKGESKYLNKHTSGPGYPAYGADLKQALKTNSIGLTIGVLF